MPGRRGRGVRWTPRIYLHLRRPEVEASGGRRGFLTTFRRLCRRKLDPTVRPPYGRNATACERGSAVPPFSYCLLPIAYCLAKLRFAEHVPSSARRVPSGIRQNAAQRQVSERGGAGGGASLCKAPPPARVLSPLSWRNKKGGRRRQDTPIAATGNPREALAAVFVCDGGRNAHRCVLRAFLTEAKGRCGHRPLRSVR